MTPSHPGPWAVALALKAGSGVAFMLDLIR